MISPGGDHMKALASLLIMFGTLLAQATPPRPPKETTVKTLLTCQRTTAGVTVQAGLLPEVSGRYRVLVVEQRAGRPEKTLVANREVSRFVESGQELYVDSNDTIRLILGGPRARTIRGELHLLQKGPGGFMLKNLTCSQLGEITFNRVRGLSRP